MKNDGELHTLTGAYALHALTPAEHEVFTAHLADCPSCRQEVAEFSATAARMAAAAALPPPARMKEEVLYGIDSVRQLPPLLPAAAKQLTFGAVLRRKAVPLALAASLAAAAALGGVSVWQDQRTDEARQQAEASERRLQDLTAVMAAPDARTVHG
ncbi:hypothetical protein VR46_28145, partial [Streptomyces sp. NRRL S-444]